MSRLRMATRYRGGVYLRIMLTRVCVVVSVLWSAIGAAVGCCCVLRVVELENTQGGSEAERGPLKLTKPLTCGTAGRMAAPRAPPVVQAVVTNHHRQSSLL